jgi:two-component system CheB/CheR fusion protein
MPKKNKPARPASSHAAKSPAGKAPAKKTPAPPSPRSASAPPFAATLTIVGIGTSAGGLEALEKFIGAIDPKSGLAYVAVTHQHPGHLSLLPELLAKCTQIKVSAATEGIRLEPDTFYLSTATGYLTITDGTLHIKEVENPEVLRLPIDNFFRSLAADRPSHAIGIILSGTASDGTLGLKTIKGAGGMIMAQEPESAKYAGMPASAIATGQVDYILPPELMPAQLQSYVAGLVPSPIDGAEGADHELSDSMRKVISLLRARTGHDFSPYKGSTMRRRIERRINIHQLKGPTEHLQFIQDNPNELDLVFRELLIGVTSFFRDPDAFTVLARQFLPRLLASHTPETPLRVWVPACSSGEEAYSLAILLCEIMEKQKKTLPLQIFGTDLDPGAIEKARAGFYPEGIVNDIRPERLKRFFLKEQQGYRITKQVREMAIFATQNVLKDPPLHQARSHRLPQPPHLFQA